ncbi:hypothetical protein K7X08_030883 [Anisodus acutangulus]|uniref:Uncharacterized protein n=1 Tax=Anisodus acutangulus TaxID=402998 RepID=A0A9Q1M015_9SOLA|nr:hypothetical protein K7X08_030883 [Anisodus acutangulus]
MHEPLEYWLAYFLFVLYCCLWGYVSLCFYVDLAEFPLDPFSSPFSRIAKGVQPYIPPPHALVICNAGVIFRGLV